jgi:hypothetical protein
MLIDVYVIYIYIYIYNVCVCVCVFVVRAPRERPETTPPGARGDA